MALSHQVTGRRGTTPTTRPTLLASRPPSRWPPSERPQFPRTVMTDVNRKDLEVEGDAAADFLEELLDILDMDGDIDISVEAGRAKVAIVSEGPSQDLKRLVGPDGEVLDALQDLTRLAVQSETGNISRLMLDIADFRAGRKEQLAEQAREIIAKVRETGEAVALPSMNAFERKVVHDVVLEAGLVSESEGEDPHRHVVVSPAAS